MKRADNVDERRRIYHRRKVDHMAIFPDQGDRHAGRTGYFSMFSARPNLGRKYQITAGNPGNI